MAHSLDRLPVERQVARGFTVLPCRDLFLLGGRNEGILAPRPSQVAVSAVLRVPRGDGRNIRAGTDVLVGPEGHDGAVRVELWIEETEPPNGWVGDQQRRRTDFVGWIGLLQVLSALLEADDDLSEVPDSYSGQLDTGGDLKLGE